MDLSPFGPISGHFRLLFGLGVVVGPKALPRVPTPRRPGTLEIPGARAPGPRASDPGLYGNPDPVPAAQPAQNRKITGNNRKSVQMG